jgi:hypothetical protein
MTRHTLLLDAVHGKGAECASGNDAAQFSGGRITSATIGRFVERGDLSLQPAVPAQASTGVDTSTYWVREGDPGRSSVLRKGVHMSVTIADVSARLAEIPGLNVLPGVRPNMVRLFFPTKRFVDPDTNAKRLVVVVLLEEDGEYIKVFSPHAFEAKGRHAGDVLRACMEIQWETKLIQFEYDESDGEIRPIIEWPIEDGTVTAKQLARAVAGLVTIVDRYAPVLEQAANGRGVKLSLASPD